MVKIISRLTYFVLLESMCITDIDTPRQKLNCLLCCSTVGSSYAARLFYVVMNAQYDTAQGFLF